MPGRQLKNSRLNSTHHFVVNRDQQEQAPIQARGLAMQTEGYPIIPESPTVAAIRITSSIMQAAKVHVRSAYSGWKYDKRQEDRG